MKRKRNLCLAFTFCLTLNSQPEIPPHVRVFERTVRPRIVLSDSLKQDARRDAGRDSFPKGPAGDYLLALLRFEPWAESIWHDYPRIPDAGYFGDGLSGGNGGIRGTCAIALNYAVLVKAFPHDPKRPHRLKRIEEVLRYVEETHRSAPDSTTAVDGKKWGVTASTSLKDPDGWQSSMWAASMGLAASMVERELDPDVIAGCKRVVAAEADWLSRKPPPSGYKLDTKAEENAWQSTIVSLAAAWLPDDPRANKWLRTAKAYLANTYTVPADTSGPLKEWITTQTLYPSFALQNHGFYHPEYQEVGGMLMGKSYLIARMINPKVAEELKPFAEHNVVNVWEFIKGIILNTGDFVFPSGLDWTLHSFNHVPYFSWIGSHFHEPEARWAEDRIGKQILYRQSLTGDGRLVGASTTYLPFAREAISSGRIALAYLQDALEGFPNEKGTPPKDYSAHYRDVGLIIQRSDNALITVSYNAPSMALVNPLKGKAESQRFFISPNTSTLIGSGPHGKTVLNEYKKTAVGFHAEFALNAEKGRKSRLVIEGMPDAVAFVEIPYADSKLPSEGWLLSAIENDSLTGGRRTVLWDGKSEMIKERSGMSTLPISTNWMNIDNWMGFVTTPKGSLDYQAATKYNRDGAAEDYLYYQPGDQSAPRAVILLPGETAAVTADVFKSLKWKLSASVCRLSFVRPNGKRAVISVPLNK